MPWLSARVVSLSARISFFVAVVATAFFTTWPPTVLGPPPQLLWDKAEHAIAFAGMAILGLAGFPRRPAWPLCISLIAYGLLIEVVQGFVGRQQDMGDLLADGVGVGLGLVIMASLRRAGVDLRSAAR